MAKPAHKLFFPYAVQIGSTVIPAITDQSVDQGITIARPQTDGQIDPVFSVVSQINPNLTCVTEDIGAMLTALGEATAINGKPITAASPITMFYRSQSNLGTRDATGLKVVGQHGLAIPVSAQAGNDQPGTITTQFALIYDDSATKTSSDTDNPLIVTKTQTLTGDVEHSVQWYAGNVILNGVMVAGVQRISVEYGLQLVFRGHAGQVWRTYVAIQSRMPKITITTDDLDLLDTYESAAAISAKTAISFRKSTAGSATRVAAATAEHVLHTINQGHIAPSPVSGGGPNTADIVIYPTDDGTNALIAIDTSAALATE